MKIVIIGAGNVATHIAQALRKANVQVAQIWSYHYQNALVLAQLVQGEAIADIAEVDLEADLCLIAVKDDAIEGIIKKLKGFKGLVAHTSGAVNLQIFVNELANYGVFYPLQTFSKTKELSFQEIPLCVEANTESNLEVLKNLASKLSSKVIAVDSEKRKIMHLAAVFACNFTNHLYALADEILEANDLDFDIIRPLIAETAEKVQKALPKDVQTGPAIRSDLETIKKHEELLKEHDSLLDIYITLSNSIKKSI